MNESLVSIITSCFNSERFISETIESVLYQTYKNWEMIIVDDCSTDNSIKKIFYYMANDNRIKLFKTKSRSGSPVEPRNIGIRKSKGQYIAFLDSDDLWLPSKLERQIKLFSSNDDVSIVFSNYEKISERGIRNKRIIIGPSSVSYTQLLKGNCIGCLTAIYDTKKVGIEYFPKVDHEDYALWLTILKKGYKAKNTNTTEAFYRIRNTSLSSKKFIVYKWTWNIYRNFLKLSLFKSIYYYCFYCIKAIIKHIK